MNRDILENQMGYGGMEYINDTAVHKSSSVYCSIQVVMDTVIAAITGYNITGNSIIGETIPAGTVIYGQFYTIQLTSGKVIAYKAV